MSTDPIVRKNKTPQSHIKVLWSQAARLAAFLGRVKEAQREAVGKAEEQVTTTEQVKTKAKRYRVFRKMIRPDVFASSGDPLRLSPLTSLEIAELKEFREIVHVMGYNSRVSLLFAQACEEKLRDIHVSIASLQEAIIRFMRKRPRKYIRMHSPNR